MFDTKHTNLGISTVKGPDIEIFLELLGEPLDGY